MAESVQELPLSALHRRLGARVVPFAGYALPLHFATGILTEHLHCRAGAALFDVSHMGQATLVGDGAAAALERSTPADLAGLRPGRQRYALLTNDAGGILDDCMIANFGDRLHLVVNASRKAHDFAALVATLPIGVALIAHPERALLALQGPRAESALGALAPELAALPFMGVAAGSVAGVPVLCSRSGYTGEDGFELGCHADHAERLAEALLAQPAVAPAGLGARDSLRLEAGLPLYGSDLDETTSPVEAGLTWTIGKRRRMAGDYPGAARVAAELADGPARRRVGLRPLGRQPARAGTTIHAADGTPVGVVTSGGFGPSADSPICMGYVAPAYAADGTALELLVRGRALPAHVVPLPFVPHRYRRATPTHEAPA